MFQTQFSLGRAHHHHHHQQQQQEQQQQQTGGDREPLSHRHCVYIYIMI
jgi:hypothetical protein